MSDVLSEYEKQRLQNIYTGEQGEARRPRDPRREAHAQSEAQGACLLINSLHFRQNSRENYTTTCSLYKSTAS